jgi:hypothetical protein
MSKPTIARYAVTFGLSGCYMPDSHFGTFEIVRRSDLAAVIRNYIRLADLPASLMRDVKITRLWSFIKQHGSSTAHFRLVYKGYELAFHGLTEDEYNEE